MMIYRNTRQRGHVANSWTKMCWSMEDENVETEIVRRRRMSLGSGCAALHCYSAEIGRCGPESAVIPYRVAVQDRGLSNMDQTMIDGTDRVLRKRDKGKIDLKTTNRMPVEKIWERRSRAYRGEIADCRFGGSTPV